ncbi:MAG: IS110 family transposase, partial [Candidatus Thiosymbion ectosymbiont of Robbea hypermnestra]|nr:IS110 family transposase [Candidatus Thiosymbion ectosymbiont of Robbea hypermnestra]
MVIPRGVDQVRRALPDMLEAGESPLSDFLRPLIAQLYEQLREYDARIQGYERQLDAVCAQEAACQRLLAVAGIGPLVAT